MGGEYIMNKNLSLSVIIPAYKEAENLKILLPELINTLKDNECIFEIVIVDTESAMDETEMVCKQYDHVCCINRIGGNFYGDAIRTGIKNAKNDKILIMDADGSHSPGYINEMLEKANEFDLVIGSRYTKGGKTDNPQILIFMSWVVNVIFRLVLKTKIRDISNSFRIYDTAQLKSIDLECSNFDIVEEILMKLFTRYPKMKYIEIPICFQKRLYGESKRNLFLFACSYLHTLYKIKRFAVSSTKNKSEN